MSVSISPKNCSLAQMQMLASNSRSAPVASVFAAISTLDTVSAQSVIQPSSAPSASVIWLMGRLCSIISKEPISLSAMYSVRKINSPLMSTFPVTGFTSSKSAVASHFTICAIDGFAEPSSTVSPKRNSFSAQPSRFVQETVFLRICTPSPAPAHIKAVSAFPYTLNAMQILP